MQKGGSGAGDTVVSKRKKHLSYHHNNLSDHRYIYAYAKHIFKSRNYFDTRMSRVPQQRGRVGSSKSIHMSKGVTYTIENCKTRAESVREFEVVCEILHSRAAEHFHQHSPSSSQWFENRRAVLTYKALQAAASSV
jgi:hypothetical protein